MRNYWTEAPTTIEAGTRLTITTSNGGRATGHLVEAWEPFRAPMPSIILHPEGWAPGATLTIFPSRLTAVLG